MNRGILLVLTLVLGCRGLPNGEEDPVHAPISHDGEIITSQKPPEKNDDLEPLDELEELWNLGRLDQARNVFEKITVPAGNSVYKEWRFWRSRLFMRTWNKTSLGLKSGHLGSLFVDVDDVWIGTWTGGLSRLSWPTDRVEVFDSGDVTLALRTVNRILRNDDAIWVLRYGNLERYDRRTSRWRRDFDLPVKERLQDLSIREAGLYLGTLGGGLWLKNGDLWRRLERPGPFITRLREMRDGRLFVATMDRGFLILDDHDGKEHWTRPPEGVLKTANVTTLIEAGPLLCVGTYGEGAVIWDRDRGTLENVRADVLGDDWILSSAASPEHLYLGTFGGGVAYLDLDTGGWGRWGITDGLPSGEVASLAWDGKALWVGTLGGGLTRISEGYHDTE